MPRQILLAEQHDRSRSLGWLGTAWIEHFVRHGPGGVQGMEVHHGEEYTQFIVDSYALGDAETNNHMLYDSVFLSRPKGTDKSGLAARFCLFEAFGPARFSGQWAKGGEIYEDPWDMGFRYEYQPGEPMGKHVRAPYIRIMATEEGQSGNTYRTVLFNLTSDECPLYYVPAHDTGREKVLLRGGGEIRTSTASSSSKDGGLETFVVFDETHLYDTPELKEMKATVARNLRKRKREGTWFLETTTMFAPGDDSAAEETFKEAESIRSGRKKKGRGRLFYDHRWGICENLADEPALRRAIAEAYGDAIAWIDVDSLVDEVYDTRSSPASVRRYFLNAQTSSSDSWIAAHEWEACGTAAVQDLQKGDTIVIGGDGAINDDATALIACRVSDGLLQPLGVWQKPDGAEGEGWQVSREAVDSCLAQAMRTYNVVGFYMDPPHWSDTLDRWHSEYAERMKVKATERRPLEWWTNRPTPMIEALERFREAVLEKRVKYAPPEDRAGTLAEMLTSLKSHVLHTKRRPTRAGMQVAKSYPGSPDKIDMCVASVIAWTCRNDAIAKGITGKKKPLYIAQRLR